ncbi:hypothetical protein MNBD_GAMMA22-2052 [hydrothermal vent metagenome]|uniref:Outer membrane protein beta-barrel domain-containing protein n=1 Tax=hydrothermal vent metagenome TaxID=652676 RepID=A0A3B1ANV4_9ZZZZ
MASLSTNDRQSKKHNNQISALLSFAAIFVCVNSVSASDLYDLKLPAVNSIEASVDSSDYHLNFRYREETGVSQRSNSGDETLGVKNFSGAELGTEYNLGQYDATIYYAVGDSLPNLLSSHRWLSIDLGVNFKFIEQKFESLQQDQSSYRTHYGAYPMVSASALFELPLSGMTASVEGSYFSYNARELSEYRAKLTYQIDNIFGVSGGWEQQQYQLDATQSRRFDKEGPFVDLFYRF